MDVGLYLNVLKYRALIALQKIIGVFLKIGNDTVCVQQGGGEGSSVYDVEFIRAGVFKLLGDLLRVGSFAGDCFAKSQAEDFSYSTKLNSEGIASISIRSRQHRQSGAYASSI